MYSKRLRCLIGYARVSTQDQNLELQREALTKALEMTDSKIESAKNLGVSIPTLYRWIPASMHA
ncbi:recombinase family protein [Verminephrobacter eiseniae]|uniref:recombinase family protein n=1 Tax=Verminephrobacter eiseniae TaxID=364317 RepID=UPI0022374A12|nr:recombinase family protein [Verminephrobacter eiseniae]MCW5239088.1 hypothetical protein [Verminephrobacter eiseniae]